MREAFDWKISRISMLEVEAVPQSCGCVWELVCLTEARIYKTLKNKLRGLSPRANHIHRATAVCG
jgi:hypothetical protein